MSKPHIPPLRLGDRRVLGKDTEGGRGTPATAPSADGPETPLRPLKLFARPRCPSCQHRSGVHPWRFWLEYQEQVWHCSYYYSQSAAPTAAAASTLTHPASGYCGHMWRVSRPYATCDTCRTRLAVEEHGGNLGYWCSVCHDFSH